MTPGKQDDRLEETRLAGRVGTPDEMRPGPERSLELRVTPQIPDRE